MSHKLTRPTWLMEFHAMVTRRTGSSLAAVEMERQQRPDDNIDQWTTPTVDDDRDRCRLTAGSTSHRSASDGGRHLDAPYKRPKIIPEPLVGDNGGQRETGCSNRRDLARQNYDSVKT